ncbi:antibiotic biosynthesis monooxygenase [Emcibacter sp.]|uniref:antibiotic biosynthesis monooxygenase n=1 Tax=Emcibacter sp. TaxID=1979954 RepID=UPI002AA6CBAB|nr:antibiotic biosynthesis monooxygenase [Emcibacter sp.]
MPIETYSSRDSLEDTAFPVTVTISRKVKKGKEKEYEEWAHTLIDVAKTFPGHQKLTIIRPSAATKGNYLFVVHFDTMAHQLEWEDSSERAEFLQQLVDRDLVEGETEITKASGFEFWFPLADVPSPSPPPRWKMVLIMIPTIIGLTLLMNYLFGGYMRGWSLEARVIVQIIFQVLLMTYVIMPRLTSLFRPWLYPIKN